MFEPGQRVFVRALQVHGRVERVVVLGSGPVLEVAVDGAESGGRRLVFVRAAEVVPEREFRQGEFL
jgi:hypothetical protein